MKKFGALVLCWSTVAVCAASDSIYPPEIYVELKILQACVSRLEPGAGQAAIEQQVQERAKARGFDGFSNQTMAESDAYYQAEGSLLTEYGLYIPTETEACVQKNLQTKSGEVVFQGVPTYPGASLTEANAVSYRVLTSDTYEKVLNFYRDELQDAGLQEKSVTDKYTILTFLYNGDNRTLTIEKTPDGSDITIIGRP